jgi:3-oxoacyl-[acyl-carrier protein] reductase
VTDDGLRDRVFLVTGSGRGLGAAIARAAGAERARVVVNCRRDEARAKEVAREVEAAGGQALALRADVTSAAEAQELVSRALARWGRIDVLVNTVGSFRWNPLVDLEPAEWQRIVASNLDSVFHMCRLVIPPMREKRFGRIVNFAAVGAGSTLGEPQMAAYSAVKSAVVALSRALALEEARRGITVNVVSPGLLRDEPPPAADLAPAEKALQARVPVGHAGRAADVVRAVLFFASPKAEFVTGQVVEVAGGARI